MKVYLAFPYYQIDGLPNPELPHRSMHPQQGLVGAKPN